MLTVYVAQTDVELVLKLFNEIGEEIAADPELAPDLSEPFKSKGCRSRGRRPGHLGLRRNRASNSRSAGRH
ncbi:hypothetical protein BQ8482_111137 [Mesorhizobium delmotii]|uniref:Uncharacterized protein n=1 Tax=Mesorhizobium delmotii TaxID=1631247 RepID=A0A2P9ADK1_9HYPH|nr:hypothetical protein BQ8482_111137 [Mesorhizobium delmotii]